MTADQIFEIVNLVALASWVVLAVSLWLSPAGVSAGAEAPALRMASSAGAKAPALRVAQSVTGTIVPILLAAVYVAVIAANWRGSEGGFSSLPDVAALFRNPWLLLAGWTHYLVFDLLIGNWEVRDARARHVPAVLVLPCLALTFLFGPAGWLLYVTMRSWRSSSPASAM